MSLKTKKIHFLRLDDLLISSSITKPMIKQGCLLGYSKRKESHWWQWIPRACVYTSHTATVLLLTQASLSVCHDGNKLKKIKQLRSTYLSIAWHALIRFRKVCGLQAWVTPRKGTGTASNCKHTEKDHTLIAKTEKDLTFFFFLSVHRENDNTFEHTGRENDLTLITQAFLDGRRDERICLDLSARTRGRDSVRGGRVL